MKEPNHPLVPNTELRTNSAKETLQVGIQLGRLLTGRETIALIGELGSGKTVFVHGIAEGLGVKETVHSPSFTILNEYQGRLSLFHFDFYRLKSEVEIWNLGWQDYLTNSGIIIIEWADRFPNILPADRLEIRFISDQNNEQKRIITFQPIGEKYTILFNSLKN